jgi:hypothetical protein
LNPPPSALAQHPFSQHGCDGAVEGFAIAGACHAKPVALRLRPAYSTEIMPKARTEGWSKGNYRLRSRVRVSISP